jgi:hypothetical protein
MEVDPCASAPTDHIPTAKIVANTVADLILSPAQDQVPSPTKLSMMRRNLVTWPQLAEAAMTLTWVSSVRRER